MYITFSEENASDAFTLGSKQLIHMFCEVISKEKNSDVRSINCLGKHMTLLNRGMT